MAGTKGNDRKTGQRDTVLHQLQGTGQQTRSIPGKLHSIVPAVQEAANRPGRHYIQFLYSERPTTSTTSKVAYFKRKYAEEEDLQKDYHGYFQKHLILPEDRTCILRLSLQKLRFLEDPEAYLRRSVLINNLLRKIHHESTKEDCECYDRASDTRKRFKMMAANCCPQPFYLEELGMVPYGCRLDFPGGPQGSSSQLLMYQIDDNG